MLVSVPGFIGAFMQTAGGFGFFRFLTGMGGIGTFMVTFVLAVEYVGPRYGIETEVSCNKMEPTNRPAAEATCHNYSLVATG